MAADDRIETRLADLLVSQMRTMERIASSVERMAARLDDHEQRISDCRCKTCPIRFEPGMMPQPVDPKMSALQQAPTTDRHKG